MGGLQLLRPAPRGLGAQRVQLRKGTTLTIDYLIGSMIDFKRAQRPLIGLCLLLSSWVLAGCDQDKPQRPERFLDLPEAQRGGKWVEAPRRPELSAEEQAQAEALAATGYAGGVTEASEFENVTFHDVERSSNELSFMVSGHGPEAFLIDMEGQVRHTWNYDIQDLWSRLDRDSQGKDRRNWRRAHFFSNGDILAIHESLGLLKLDKDSNLLWVYDGSNHHDLHVTPDGHIWCLGRKVDIYPVFSDEKVAMDDLIIELDPDGKELRRISILECLQKIDSKLLERIRERDMLHSNSIEVLDGRIAAAGPAFVEGNILISLRHLDAVLVIDPEAAKVVWTLTGDFRRQHDAQITEAGTLLLFDNHHEHKNSSVSKILEFDPASKELLWSFAGSEALPFYSMTCGTTQRLDNGNTLICESDAGRAFEITSDGELVWEFYNPHRAGEDNQYIGALYALHRVGHESEFDWLTPLGE